MGVLDIFSGQPGRQAAIWGAANQQQGLAQQRADLGGGAALSLAALGGGMKQARGDLSTHNFAARRDLANYNQKAINALRGAGATADKFLAPLGAEANRGFSVYGDAAGVNGAAGQDRARANFRAGPGYEFTVNEGVNAATRAANASGMAASGNTLDATTRLGANLADKEWDDYMAHLAPYLNLAPQIAGKRADLTMDTGKGLAGLYQGHGVNAAGVSQGLGNTLASLGTGYGVNQANIYTGLGQNLSNVTGAATGQTTQLGTAGAMAGQQGNANAWNAGMQVANLLASNASQASKAIKAFQ